METVFNFIRRGGTLALLAATFAACGGDDSDDGTPQGLDDARPVMSNYAANVRANYEDSLSSATALKTAIDAFVLQPNDTTLLAARDAWKASREPYELTEGYRFYDGPIDNPEDGPEGLLNSWPLDEAYIDYVFGMPTAGMINDATALPMITQEALAAKNAADSETHISTGYHAIEFLLWGQDITATGDPNVDGAGTRPPTDYVPGGAVPNADRRAAYLQATTDLLIANLTQVNTAWADSGDNYRSEFVAAEPKEALRRILLGIGSLAGSELSGERIETALDNMDQEDEHSCFSDNTNRDLILDAQSIENIYFGIYAGNDGVGLDELVEARDPELNAKMKTQLADTKAKIGLIPVPFDHALMDLDDGIAKGRAAVAALRAETDTIVEIGTLLDIQINLE